MQENAHEKTTKLKLDEISSPMLAYLGDAVIELLVRRKLALDGVPNSGEANRLSHGYVTAKAQSDAVGRLKVFSPSGKKISTAAAAITHQKTAPAAAPPGNTTAQPDLKRCSAGSGLKATFSG